MSRLLALVLVIAASLAACGGNGNQGPSATQTVGPARTGTPTASAALASTPDTPRFQLTTVLDNAQSPLALKFAPDGTLFYNERGGRVRLVTGGKLQDEPFAEVNVITNGEHGLLGLALDPDFQRNHYVYVLYSAGDAAGRPDKQRVVRFTDANSRGIDETVIIDGLPIGQSIHNAGRLAFGPDGKLYVSIGDTGDSNSSQDTGRLSGKILRYNPDGSVPGDNPISGSPVWAWGLRNTFGLAFAPDGTLWATDNGDSGHDELDRISKGGNYGWPQVRGIAGDPRFVDPLASSGDDTWVPTGIAFLPTAAGADLFFCSYRRERLLRVSADSLSGHAVTPEDTGQPCAFDVTLGPDGALYLADLDAIRRWGQP